MRVRADTVIGALLVIFVATLFAVSFGLPPAPYETMGPALFPRFILVAVFPMCLVLFVKSAVRDFREGPAEREFGSFAEWFDNYRNVLAVYLLFFMFAWALPWAGYLASGFFFLLLAQLALGPKGWGKVPQFLAVTTGILALLYFIFRVVLLVLLPEGEIGLM